MHWDNLEQIAAYFNLDVSADDSLAIRKAIIKQMAEIHPDTNKQESKSEETKSLWHELNSAKEFIESRNNEQQLIPLSKLPDILRSINSVSKSPMEMRISSVQSDAQSELRNRVFLPRIGSGVLSAICAFIFMFPSNFEDHRLLGDYIRLYSVQWGLLILSAYAGIFFIFTWLREQSSKSQVEWLTTDEGMRDFIRHILLNKQGEEDPGKRRFSDRELIITLASDGNRNMFPFSVMLPMHSQVSRSVAEKIVQIHIDKYIQRGVIVELPQKGFDRIFEINKAAREDLKVQ